MTAGDYKKALKQLKDKPGKLSVWKKHNTPNHRDFGESTKKCRICGRTGGHINKYGLHVCRQCFRENANELGFRKYN
jgi:ribosomal protein S14